MEMDFKQLYYDLNDLLEDICKFLSNEKLTNLSQTDRTLAESLIQRSKKQLQEISRIQCTAQNEEYVIMDRKDDTREDKEAITANKTILYKDLPAQDTESVKCGYILMKRKILLGFGKMKRVYANIHNDVLLIYYTEKDSKPIGLIDLKNYTAKENTESTSRNFNLICDSPEQKPLHFIAPTREEMMQWVWQINKIHDGLIEPDLESVSSDAEYDVMKNNPCTPKKSTESDELYEELETVKDKLRVSNLNERVEIRPPLPGRIQLKKSPIKVAPPVVKSLPSQILDEPVSSSPKNSEDEDNTYEVFADLKCEIQIVHENEDESAEQGTAVLQLSKVSTSK
ncbi:unnamed protein product [Acanthoscelides obtectus]|uniref:PH domain-containing protein n=1 Tax=Acanthoscelides obtectus TaxID=200917 RepID=A0A9P0K2Y7_ACAOB|nr:unnamed protein product [Acanthoscelides obtectus]CAK1628820.1 hypothetical protein AOBTE_LOCUS5418 [Acanthoscelides obtectus]